MHADPEEEVASKLPVESRVTWHSRRRKKAEAEESCMKAHLHVGAQPSQVMRSSWTSGLLQIKPA
jgi:hypothetical protein